MYDGQLALVMTDAESGEFHVWRGTKQGDLQRSLLFNAVLQHVMTKDIEQCKREDFESSWVKAQITASPMNLCFAGDVMLFASSRT